MLRIDGRGLTLEDVARVARGEETEVELTPEAGRVVDLLRGSDRAGTALVVEPELVARATTGPPRG